MQVSTMASPVLKQNNGLDIPVLGLGTYLAAPSVVGQAVKDAIDAGYRYFDCAHYYANEKQIGDAIRAKIDDGTVQREDLFITSKLWNTFHRQDMVVPACKGTLQRLGLDYIDLYLIHAPFAYKDGNAMVPKHDNGDMIYSNVDYLDTWQGMEQCREMGLTRSIGVSNFNGEQIERLLAVASVKPTVNQVEVHPLLSQKKLIAFCKSRGILVTGYCPLGRPETNLNFLEDAQIAELAEKYDKSPAQIVLNHLVSLGITVVPRSTNKQHIGENIDIFDFELTPEDTAIMDSLNRNLRICTFLEAKKHKHYPFHTEF